MDQHKADELELYIDNTESLYKATQYVNANMLRKQRAGTYDSVAAIRAYEHVVREAQRVTGLRIGVAERRAVAVSLRDSFEAEAKLGNLDHLLEAKR